MIGHCAGAMLFDMAGVIDGKTIAVHPLAKSAIQKGKATDNKSEADGNILVISRNFFNLFFR